MPWQGKGGYNGPKGNQTIPDGPFTLHLRGLPFKATKNEILNFMEIDRANIVKFVMCRNEDGRPSGEAFMIVADQVSGQLALNQHKAVMPGYTRYIEVLRVDVKKMIDKCGDVPDWDGTIKFKGMPFQCNILDVEKFLGSCKWKEDGIFLPVSDRGNSSGYCYIQFDDLDEAESCLQKNNCSMIGRYVQVFESSNAELRKAKIEDLKIRWEHEQQNKNDPNYDPEQFGAKLYDRTPHRNAYHSGREGGYFKGGREWDKNRGGDRGGPGGYGGGRGGYGGGGHDYGRGGPPRDRGEVRDGAYYPNGAGGRFQQRDDRGGYGGHGGRDDRGGYGGDRGGDRGGYGGERDAYGGDRGGRDDRGGYGGRDARMDIKTESSHNDPIRDRNADPYGGNSRRDRDRDYDESGRRDDRPGRTETYERKEERRRDRSRSPKRSRRDDDRERKRDDSRERDRDERSREKEQRRKERKERKERERAREDDDDDPFKNIVQMFDVPKDAEASQIQEFFRPYKAIAVNIGDDGEVDVAFKNHDHAERAMSKEGERFLGSKIKLKLNSKPKKR